MSLNLPLHRHVYLTVRETILIPSKINSYKKTNRVNYLYSPTNSSSIEIIKNKAFVDYFDVNLEFVTSSLWDCSTIAPLSTLIIDNKEYFSLDAHTLITI